MRSRYGVREPNAPHFITCTVVGWVPIFTTAARCDILVQALQYAREHKGLKVYAWVIMENHLHAIVKAPDLPQVIADFKRHTAQTIMDEIRGGDAKWLLNQFEYFRARHKTESVHQFWQEGFHPQALTDDSTIDQKLDYVHNNPVQRGMVAAPEHWRYSSAHEWLVGAEPAFRCDRWDERTN